MMGTASDPSGPGGFLGLLIVALFIAWPIYTIRIATRYARATDTPTALCVAVSIPLAIFLFLFSAFVLALLSAGIWGGAFFAIAALALVLLPVEKLRRRLPLMDQERQRLKAAESADSDVFYRVDFSKPTPDETVERVRAENRAAAERDQITRLANAAAMADSTRRNSSVADVLERKQRKETPKGKRLAQVRFSYVDLDGVRSDREVHVFAVNTEKFEGRCQRARATRTFLLSGVQGDILDIESGELIDPARWALALKKSTGGGKFAAVSIRRQSYEKPGRKPAIHFTGFRQAEKEALEEQAELAGLYVAESVVKDLRYLVVGPTQSKKKIADAEAIGAEVLDRDEFSMRF